MRSLYWSGTLKTVNKVLGTFRLDLLSIQVLLGKGVTELPEDYTECPRRNVPNFGRVFLMLNYTDITQNTYIQS